MPSPSSPLEYRPTPHLVLFILFFVFPLIYLCSRVALTLCCILACALKMVFARLIHLLYDFDVKPSATARRRPTPVKVEAPSQTIRSAIREETLVETQPSEEEDEEEEASSFIYFDAMIWMLCLFYRYRLFSQNCSSVSTGQAQLRKPVKLWCLTLVIQKNRENQLTFCLVLSLPHPHNSTEMFEIGPFPVSFLFRAKLWYLTWCHKKPRKPLIIFG
ncbi:unnamed protein product [Gongylonema pulchrum]|uniref:Pecanex-like protein n=1 Tax=Gongylonema pulchrum TaxID=637853 RepID=A0A183E9A7_9BILA|nr:unnamed protein product [Gongylonema pulchrum]